MLLMLYTSILCKYIALKKINKYNKNRAISLILFSNAAKNIFFNKNYLLLLITLNIKHQYQNQYKIFAPLHLSFLCLFFCFVFCHKSF